VNFHHLNNLIWVWSMDRPSTPERAHALFFPGAEYVDVLALDVYGSDFAQSYYDSIAALSQGKPMALAEVGSPPSPEILKRQPRWAYYMTWATMVRNTSHQDYDALMHDPQVLSLEDPAYWAATAGYRKACGLPPLHVERPPADFSGTWALNEERSQFGRMGPGGAAVRLEIAQQGGALSVKSTRVIEYADDQTSEETLALDGSETKSQFMNSPRVTTAKLSADGAELVIDSVITFTWGAPGTKSTSEDVWTLVDGGRSLSIQRHSSSPRGEQNSTLVYNRL
jgi:hypothetical protein